MTSEMIARRIVTLSRFKKERFLLSLSEDEFRDRVVRPLFLRQGLKDGRDLCGPTERGKDALFIAQSPLGVSEIYVVQTKRGNVNLSRKASENLVQASVQLRTALATRVTLLATKQRKLPDKALLVASGKINDGAREHIIVNFKMPA